MKAIILILFLLVLTVSASDFHGVITDPSQLRGAPTQQWIDELSRNLTLHISENYTGNITIFYGMN